MPTNTAQSIADVRLALRNLTAEQGLRSLLPPENLDWHADPNEVGLVTPGSVPPHSKRATYVISGLGTEFEGQEHGPHRVTGRRAVEWRFESDADSWDDVALQLHLEEHSNVFRIRWPAGIEDRLSALHVLLTLPVAVLAPRLLLALPFSLVLAPLLHGRWTDALSLTKHAGLCLAETVRARDESTLLIGHSLGARIVLEALQSLCRKPPGRPVRAILLAPAVGQNEVDRALFNEAIDAELWASPNDTVLTTGFKLVTAGSGRGKAIGAKGFGAPDPVGFETVIAPDVLGRRVGHGDYVNLIPAIRHRSRVWSEFSSE